MKRGCVALVAGALLMTGVASAQRAGGGRGGGQDSGAWKALGAPVRWDITEGGAAVLSLPSGTTALGNEALPSPDLSMVTGMRLVLRRGVSRGASSSEHQSDGVYVVCARAPSTTMAAGMESLVFDKLNEVARTELTKAGFSIDAFRETSAQQQGQTYVAGYVAEGRASGVDTAGGKLKMRAEGKHVFGFVGEAPDVLVCSIACTELSSESARICPSILEAASVDATFVPAPEVTGLTKVLGTMLTKPLSVLGVLLGGILMLAGLIVALMPARKPASSPMPEAVH